MRGNGNDGAQTKRKAGSKAADENHEKTPIKRQRVSRACDQCRGAREKCDGIQPVCFTCASSNRDCSYTTNPKKRGIQPGYIKSLELGLAWIFSNVAGSEVALHTMLTAENGQGSSLLVGKDTAESDKLHKKWRRSTVCKEVDRLLSGSDAVENDRLSPDTPDPDPEASNASQTQSGISNLPTPHSPVAARNQASRQPEGVLLSPTHPSNASIPRWERNPVRTNNQPNGREDVFAFQNLHGLHTLSLEASERRKLILPNEIWRLFDIHFAYTHSWLPISEKHDLLKISYSYPEDGLELSAGSPGSGQHAELWGVLALASVQEASASTAKSIQDESPLRSSEELYNTAKCLIPSPSESGSELGHVKALLLLALVNLGLEKPEIAWLQVGHASRLLTYLEQRIDHPSAKPELKSRLKHVFAGCFMLDTIISTQLGQIPYIKSSDVERRGPVDEDGLEEWHPWVGCEGFGVKKETPPTRTPVHSLSIFNRLVRLISIISVSQSPEDSLRPATLGTASRIDAWTASLPKTCSFVRTGNITTTSTPPVLLLRVVYLFAASISDSSIVRPIDEIIDLLEYFAEIFGMVTIPSVVSCFISTIIHHQGFEVLNANFKTRIRNFRTNYAKAWSPTSTVNHNRAMTLSTGLGTHSSNPTNLQLPTPESIYTPFQPTIAPLSSRILDRPRPLPALFQGILPDMSPSAPIHSKPPTSAPSTHHLSSNSTDPSHCHPDYQDLSLDAYNPGATMDLDAFFDELASLDGAENHENQPQFMQNLGFAPDADLTDVLASDYGQFDPLLSAFLNPGVS